MNNYLIINVTGKNIYKFLLRCKDNNIQILSSNIISYKEAVIKINYDDYDKLNKIKSVYKLSIINKTGFIKIKELIYKYKILLISSFVGISFLIFLSNIIFKVTIISDNNALNDKIIKDLNALGIRKYSLKKSYDDICLIKEKLLEKYNDSVEWLEIKENGIVYEVQVVERKKVKKLKKTDYTNIIAKKSGVIKKLMVEDGTKAVELNNYVNKGEVLISGIIKKDEDVKGLTHAIGKVYAEVWYNINIEYPLNYKEKRYTNRKRKTLYLKIGNKYFNLFKYKNMDREVLVSYKNRLLPFEFGIEKQSEVKIINDKLSIKEAKNKAIFKAKQELLDTLDKDEYIIDQKALNFYQKNSKIVLDMFFTCYEEIGEEETITLEE